MMITYRIQLKFVITYLLLILPQHGADNWSAGPSNQIYFQAWPRLLYHDVYSVLPRLSHEYPSVPLPGSQRRKDSPQRRILNGGPAPHQKELPPVSDKTASHPAWAQLERLECGESAADRIIGGTNTVLGQFPWLVRLGYSSPKKEPQWLCGGALISDRHVVTAAHCTVSRDETLTLTTVRLGEHNIKTDPDCQLRTCAPKVQDRKIRRITSHPQFKGYHNDIAILELETKVQLHDYVSPICLPRSPQHNQLRMGEPLTVAGWGIMNMSTENQPEILQVVQVPLVPPETCDSYGRNFVMTSGELCAGAQANKDACAGDSGGPLMKVYDTPEGPKSFLVGVVSFGPSICGIKKPGVYSSVAHFLSWILDNIM